MAKRPCFSDHSPRVTKRDYDRFNADELWESLFSVADSALMDASLDGLVESKFTDHDQNNFIQRAFHLSSVLLEAGKKCARRRAAVHNASVWPLPTDLTIKVFSMLDTPSVCSAAATCLFFKKCAMDPVCYANIDFPTLVPKVTDSVVSTLIQRAGNALQSVKLGGQGKKSYILTSSCLSSLSAKGRGWRLRRLHLYRIKRMDNTALLALVSVCPSLVDVEIVRLNDEVSVSDTLESVSRHCCLLERFIYESCAVTVTISACEEFVLNCPKITTLALKTCVLSDPIVYKLVKGFRKLKFVDFTQSARLIGTFLRKLGNKRLGGNKLEVIILRECLDLHKWTVEKSMEALVAGRFRRLRHLDISHTNSLALSAYMDDRRSYRLSSVLIKQLSEQRPNLCFVTEYPEKSDDTDFRIDNEDREGSNSVTYEESSDEEDNLPI